MDIQELQGIWIFGLTGSENYAKLQQAFMIFGMPVFDMTENNFLHHQSWDVFSFDTPPSSIDIMVIVKGLDFDECYSASVIFEEESLSVRTINVNDLKQAKKASGRPKDINDLENLL